MTGIKGKATFEFGIPNNETTEGKSVYSPVFSTGDNMFWQLEYQPNDPENTNCCLIFLTAIPNPEEAVSTHFWNDRANVSASLFVKTSNYNRTYCITTDDYSVRSKSWGKNFNKIRDYMPITIGVTFQNSIVELKGYNSSLTTQLESKNIIETWANELNVPENSDVLFNLHDGVIYANKSILSNRSEYFSGFFKGRWAELQHQTKIETESNSSSSTDVIDSSRYINVDVPDTSKVIFLEMLRYIYTDEVRFNLVSPIEMFKIADKYLLTTLRQKARVEIFKKLSIKNAMNVLFGEAWKWNDLKEDIMDYIVENFQTMKETPEYKKLADEHKGHPAGIEIFQEIVDKLMAKQIIK